MLCHIRPTPKLLYVTPPGGIGNRLITIFTAIAYCVLEKYDGIIIRWAVNSHCHIDLDAIIKLRNINHQIVKTEDYIIGPNDSVEKRFLIQKNVGLFGTGFIYETMHNIDNNFSSEYLMQWVINNIGTYIDFVPYKPIASVEFGVHCRRSDWGVTSKNNHDITDNLFDKRTILDIEFEKFISPIVTNHSTFLSTDSIRTEQYIKSKHPHIITMRKSKYPTSTDRDAIMTKEALIDLHTLAASRTIIRDSNSTFSYIAALMNGGLLKPNRLITWSRPVLQVSGPGFGI